MLLAVTSWLRPCLPHRCHLAADDLVVGLECEAGKTIAAVEFASFGTPTGYCGHFEVGTCNDPDTSTVVEGLCLNKQ